MHYWVTDNSITITVTMKFITTTYDHHVITLNAVTINTTITTTYYYFYQHVYHH